MTSAFAGRNAVVGGGFVGELSALYAEPKPTQTESRRQPLVYRRIEAKLRRAGLVVNYKRFLWLMLGDNLLCLRTRLVVPMTTNSRQLG
jgi:hypothetical protein